MDPTFLTRPHNAYTSAFFWKAQTVIQILFNGVATMMLVQWWVPIMKRVKENSSSITSESLFCQIEAMTL